MRPEDIRQEFARVAALPNEQIDLASAALLIAAPEYPNLDVGLELSALDSLAAVLSGRMGRDWSALFHLNVLSEYLFDEIGFRGNREEYHDPRNSFLNEVLDRRLGIPITLSLVYIEVGKRLGIPLIGIGMPGHFLVKHRDVDDLYVDTFGGGILISEEECAQRFRGGTGTSIQWDPRYLAPVNNRDFLARMLRNLKATYLQRHDYQHTLVAVDRLVMLLPDAVHERRDRGLVNYQLGNYTQAQQDLEGYLASASQGSDLDAVRDLIGQIQQMLGH